jgi:hypothetical protein
MENVGQTSGLPADPLFQIDGRNGVWSIAAWCAQFGCSEPFFHALKPKPREVRIGKRKIRITESPAAFAERMRRAQAKKKRAA